jgi:hypothetical protein
MDLLIALLMTLGVYATPEDLKNQDFLDKNSEQIQRVEDQLRNTSGSGTQEKTIIVVGSGNG